MLGVLLSLACNGGGGRGPQGLQPDDSAPEVTDTGTPDSGDDSGTKDTGPTDTAPKDTGEIAIITGTATVRDNPDNPFSAFVTVTLDLDATVSVAYGELELDHATPAVDVLAGVPTDILVLGLHAGTKVALRADAAHGLARWSSDPLAFTTAELPTGWPTCTPTFSVDETDVDPDEVVCTQGALADGTDVYYCTDYWGEPVFSLRTPQSDSLMSMEPLMDGSWASTSFTDSKLVFFDRNGQVVETLRPSALSGATRFEHEFIDSHEVYQIREGKWRGGVVFITGAYEYLENGDYKLGNGIVVLDPTTYDVLYDYSFQGDLSDGVSMDPLLPYSRAGIGDYYQDWLHANAVLHGIDEDGREYFLVSLKSQDWIVKLYADTDELAWALGYEGQFTLVDDIDAKKPVELDPYQWPYHQHGMRFLDAKGPRLGLVMFDNGYPRHDEDGPNWTLQYSRFVEMTIDLDTSRAELDFTYGKIVGPDHFFSSTCGNALLLPDGERAMGMIGESNTIIEVSYPDGENRWGMRCDNIDWCSYQVHWFPSLYETTWIYE
jgi:hypothetical protein